MEGIGTSLGQNARGNVKMEVILQGLSYFARKYKFWVQGCFGGFEDLLARVYGLV